MCLDQIRQGMIFEVERIPDGMLKMRLRQFGLTEGMTVKCRMARNNILALQWPGTVVAIRRNDVKNVVCRGIKCGQ